MSEPIQLVPNRPDAEIAAEIKAHVEAAYKAVLPHLDEAASKGFVVQAGLQMGPFGKFIIAEIKVMKVFG